MSEYGGTYSTDDEDQLPGEDTLGKDGAPDDVDELDRGYSPPEGWSAGEGFGNTPYEESVGESFAQRLAQEEPDGSDETFVPDEQSESAIDDGEVGRSRAGRIVAAEDGWDVGGRDVGIDGAAASAEEAAMHVVDDEDRVLDDSDLDA